MNNIFFIDKIQVKGLRTERPAPVFKNLYDVDNLTISATNPSMAMSAGRIGADTARRWSGSTAQNR